MICPLMKCPCHAEKCALWGKDQCVIKGFFSAISEFATSAVSVLIKPLQPIIHLAVKEFIEERKQEIEDAEKRTDGDIDTPF